MKNVLGAIVGILVIAFFAHSALVGHGEAIEKGAVPIVNAIVTDYSPKTEVKCLHVELGEEVSTNLYNAVATFDDGRTIDIAIKDEGEHIKVEIPDVYAHFPNVSRQIQASILSGYTNTTIGEAFNAKLSNCKFTEITTKNGTTVVEITGHASNVIPIEDSAFYIPKGKDVLVQITVRDSTFGVSFARAYIATDNQLLIAGGIQNGLVDLSPEAVIQFLNSIYK